MKKVIHKLFRMGLPVSSKPLPSLSDEQTCLDGKMLRGSRGQSPLEPDATGGRRENQEITAIPDLLWDIAEAVVSIDAMGCRKSIARTIIDAKADYLLAMKDKHKSRRRQALA